jgi:hypothetical protein
VRDPPVECGTQDRALLLERRRVAEVVPQTERQSGKLQPAEPAGTVGHPLVAIRGWHVAHAPP